ncbi:hypothetical protein N656DRAFT_372231 [Canariomyces notabilis]|uniref:Uncharacterized protein n=1 Tax=Canariomyces notabilis TaxID=2074819 RepID=A0AAN6T8J7_9PEZI|nr:hypothetical protein N656DRAFT_372231 [Canariomyces arenarius]
MHLPTTNSACSRYAQCRYTSETSCPSSRPRRPAKSSIQLATTTSSAFGNRNLLALLFLLGFFAISAMGPRQAVGFS